MKILHILHELKYSGAEIMYVDAASDFQRKGCELTVMATASELGEFAPSFDKAGYKILHCPMPSNKQILGRIIYYNKIVKLFKSEQFDAVHIHSSQARWGFALCSYLANTRSIYTFHNVFKSRVISYPVHFFQRWSAKKIFNCKYQTISDSVFNNELKLYKNTTTKIYNWYNPERYFPAIKGEKNKIRKELNIDRDSYVLISIGGCSDIKQHNHIIKALPIILDKIPNCIYLHLGKGPTEEYEIDLANKLGVFKNIKFIGNQTDVRKYLIASDVYLMPSKFEGISLTTVEAMACEIPTILYNVPGLWDFNHTGKNSLLINADHLTLAKEVIRFCGNPEEFKKMIQNAEKFVSTAFDMQANAEKIYEMYL
jgi:glycosyltransferase involved in cell wall biosynthesis